MATVRARGRLYQPQWADGRPSNRDQNWLAGRRAGKFTSRQDLRHILKRPPIRPGDQVDSQRLFHFLTGSLGSAGPTERSADKAGDGHHDALDVAGYAGNPTHRATQSLLKTVNVRPSRCRF